MLQLGSLCPVRASLKCWICMTVQCWSMVRFAAVQIGVAGQPLAPVALDCFQPQGLQFWPLADLDRFAWQQVGNLQCLCSMGRLASLKCWICLTVQCWSMVRLAGAATSCSGQICFATKTCSWKPVQIGVAGQPLASELGWFDQCSWCFQPQGFAVLDFGRFAMAGWQV